MHCITVYYDVKVTENATSYQQQQQKNNAAVFFMWSNAFEKIAAKLLQTFKTGGWWGKVSTREPNQVTLVSNRTDPQQNMYIQTKHNHSDHQQLPKGNGKGPLSLVAWPGAESSSSKHLPGSSQLQQYSETPWQDEHHLHEGGRTATTTEQNSSRMTHCSKKNRPGQAAQDPRANLIHIIEARHAFVHLFKARKANWSLVGWDKRKMSLSVLQTYLVFLKHSFLFVCLFFYFIFLDLANVCFSIYFYFYMDDS